MVITLLCLVMYGVSVTHWALVVPWNYTDAVHEYSGFEQYFCAADALLLVNVSVDM